MIAPATPQPTVPKTSGALVFQIFNPVNYAEGAPADAFQRSVAPASGMAQPLATGSSQATAPTAPNPFANPQQQLTDAYNQALNARNAAEQARNSYLNMANQLNSQAYQGQANPAQQPAPPSMPQQQNPYFTQNPYSQPPSPFDPMAQQQQAALAQQQQQAMQAQQQYQQQLQQMQQQQYQQQLQQQQALEQQQQQALQQQQQQALQQQQMQQQQPQPPEQPQQPQQPQGLENSSTEELNRMISQPQTLQEKVDAMEEIGVRGQGTAETYELLKQEALADTSMIPPGQAQDDANYVRQAALWTLGMLNKSAGSQTPTDKLPGLGVVEQIINNKSENPEVKAAAIQALQVIGRLDDKRIKKILTKASKDKNPDVQRLAKEAIQGKTIPLPTQGAMPAGMPGGFDPSMLNMAGQPAQ
jgi:hypothetical protein